MPNINAYKNTTFAQKRSFSLPWQDLYKTIDQSEVTPLIEQGKELGVQGPNQSSLLPLRSAQDLAEFDFFQGGSDSNDLEDPELAQQLADLNASGAHFSRRDQFGENKELGPYGAYNFLTGQLQLNAFRLAFTQNVPSVVVKNKNDFQKHLECYAWTERQTASTPPELRERHRTVLYEAALKSPDIQNEGKVKALAASYLSDIDGPWKNSTWGVLPHLFEGLKEVEGRKALILELCQAKNSSGKPSIKRMASARALYTAALEQDQSNEAYFESVMKNCASEDKTHLSRTLGQHLFPERWKLVEKFTQAEEDNSEYQSALIRVMHEETGVSDPAKIAELAQKKLRNELNTLESKNIFLVMTKSLAKTSRRARLTLKILDRPDDRGDKMQSDHSNRDFLLSQSIAQDVSDKKYMQTLRRISSNFGLRTELDIAAVFFPEESTQIQEWTKDLPEKSKETVVSWFSEAMIRRPDFKNTAELLEKIPKVISERHYRDEDLGQITDLYQSVLSEPASSGNGLARAAIEVTKSRRPDGESIFQEQKEIHRFFSPFFDPNLSQAETFEECMKECPYQYRADVAMSLLKGVHPEQAALIKRLTLMSDSKRRSSNRVILAAAALEGPHQNATELIQKALTLKKGVDHPYTGSGLRRLLAEESATTNEVSRLMLVVADSQDFDNEYLLSKTARKRLVKLATKPNSNKKELLEEATKDLKNEDAVQIRGTLGRRLFPELAERADLINRFSGEKSALRNWNLLFQALCSDPKLTDTQKIVRNGSHLFAEGKIKKGQLGYYRMALKATAADNRLSMPLLEGIIGSDGYDCVESSSAISLLRAALEPGVKPSEMLRRVLEEGNEKDSGHLAKLIARVSLDPKQGSYISEVLSKLDSDEYSPQEILEILQTVDQANPDKTVSTEIGLEEELLIVGDEVLEVDLG